MLRKLIDRLSLVGMSMPLGFILGWGMAQADAGNWHKMAVGVLVMNVAMLVGIFLWPPKSSR